MSQEQDNIMLREIIANVVTMRYELLKELQGKPSREDNIYKDCHWLDTNQITVDVLKKSFQRNPYGARTVELFPKECWQVLPVVYETDNLKEETDFERAFKKICATLQGDSWFSDIDQMSLWSYVKELDIKSGIGTYGVMLLGLSDGKNLKEPVTTIDSVTGKMKKREKPVPGVKKTDTSVAKPESPATPITDPIENLLFGVGGFTEIPATSEGDGLKKTEEIELQYIRVFDESQVKVTEWEREKSSPRYGQPVMYAIDMYDPTSTNSESLETINVSSVYVHWTRIIHVAEDGHVFGVPRQRPVFNSLADLQKLLGASAEMYWRGAFPGLSLEYIPKLGGDVKVDDEGLREQMFNYQSGLQRYLALMGMQAKSLAPQVVDPTKQILAHIQAICVKLGCPLRKFMGSEIGELASSQDDSVWNDRLRERQRMHITPNIIVPIINRLIMCGVLPEPEQYYVWWPDLETVDASTLAEVSLKRTQALVQFIQGDGETILPLRHFYTKILGFTEPETAAILQEAEEQLSDPSNRITQDPREKQAMEAEMQQKQFDQQMQIKEKEVSGKLRMAGKGFSAGNLSKRPSFVGKRGG